MKFFLASKSQRFLQSGIKSPTAPVARDNSPLPFACKDGRESKEGGRSARGKFSSGAILFYVGGKRGQSVNLDGQTEVGRGKGKFSHGR